VADARSPSKHRSQSMRQQGYCRPLERPGAAPAPAAQQAEGNIPKRPITAGGCGPAAMPGFTRMGHRYRQSSQSRRDGLHHIYEGQLLRERASGLIDSGSMAARVGRPPTSCGARINTMMKYDVILMACAGATSATRRQDRAAARRQWLLSVRWVGQHSHRRMKLNMVPVREQRRPHLRRALPLGGCVRTHHARTSRSIRPAAASNPASIAPDGHAPFG